MNHDQISDALLAAGDTGCEEVLAVANDGTEFVITGAEMFHGKLFLKLVFKHYEPLLDEART